MVGRCADYALEDYDKVLSLFIHADMDAKIRRIARIYDLTDVKAKELIVTKINTTFLLSPAGALLTAIQNDSMQKSW